MRQTITIWNAVRNTSMEVRAQVAGVWALHRGIGDTGSRALSWSVTHVPSGACVGGLYSRKEAGVIWAALAWHWRGWARHDAFRRPSMPPKALRDTVARARMEGPR